MLNNFCFRVYAQKSLFIGENVNFFFDILITRTTDIRVHRAGSQLKRLVRRNYNKSPDQVVNRIKVLHILLSILLCHVLVRESRNASSYCHLPRRWKDTVTVGDNR